MGLGIRAGLGRRRCRFWGVLWPMGGDDGWRCFAFFFCYTGRDVFRIASFL